MAAVQATVALVAAGEEVVVVAFARAAEEAIGEKVAVEVATREMAAEQVAKQAAKQETAEWEAAEQVAMEREAAEMTSNSNHSYNQKYGFYTNTKARREHLS